MCEKKNIFYTYKNKKILSLIKELELLGLISFSFTLSPHWVTDSGYYSIVNSSNEGKSEKVIINLPYSYWCIYILLSWLLVNIILTPSSPRID